VKMEKTKCYVGQLEVRFNLLNMCCPNSYSSRDLLESNCSETQLHSLFLI